jgi:hypothetical protein
MRLNTSRLLGALLLVCSASVAHATQYPPGPSGANPDTLIYVDFVQNPAATPHPVPPDTVWGIAGIITGFDPIATGFAIYIQNNAQDGSGNPAPWTGLDIFTGGNNYISLFTPALALGDSIVVYGRMEEFQGEGEMVSFNGAFGLDRIIVRRVSTGNPVPRFKISTVNQLQELPTNLNAEQWEGCLVRVNQKLRVVRNSATGGLGINNFIAVSSTGCPPLGPCDSLFIDGNTLASPAIAPPPVGALVDSVQGIYNQRTRGYRIQLRDGQDLFDSSPPTLQDAFAISADSVRVVFDRNLTLASAQNVLNYTLSSTLGSPDAAVRQVIRNIVHLKVTNGLAACDPEGVTVNGVVNEANGQAMTSAQSRSFFNGICPIASIQAPDPAGLAAIPCDDRSRFAGAGSALGGRITTRGVCTMTFGSNYWIQDAAGGVRSGTLIFAPSTALTVGRQYVVAGAIQEFFTETELVGTVYIKDQGVVAVPAPIVQTVGVLRDTTCDSPGPGLGTQTHVSTGEDYEGVLVQVVDVRTVDERTAGQSFFVAGPYPSNPDTILIDNNVTRTFDPAMNQYVTVSGVLDLSFGTFRIQPRGNADIVVNPTLGVENPLPTGVSFAVTPNPARSSRVTFGLPKRDRVQIGVYDLAGRKRAVLADGEYPAGTHTLDWDGKDLDGNPVGSGVYFYQLQISGQTHNRRGVLIN